MPLTKPLDTVFNIGEAAGTPLDDADYAIPFPFDGKIDKLTDRARAADAHARGRGEAQGSRGEAASRQVNAIGSM